MKLPPPFSKDFAHIQVIIETPKGSPGKYVFDPDLQLFQLTKILPAGTVFPLNFGFIPDTKADDGDPIDVLVLASHSLAVGCWVECRIVGVIQAEQQDKGKEPERNDRIVAIPIVSHEYELIQTIDDLGPKWIEEITHFFKYYRSMSGSQFTPLGVKGPKEAIQWITQKIES
ncbi:inorganic diphosphatase [Spirosoma arboris]|nr:inorganic diphosphatase [Spirosoma arboris]